MSKSINPAAAISIVSGFGLEALNAELSAKGFPAVEAPPTAAQLLVASVRSQGEFAGLLLNLTEGRMAKDDLTEHLKAAFPTAKVGDRHAAYYMSHARTGQLSGCRFVPPTANELKRKANPNPQGPRVAELSAEELARAAEWKAAEEAAASKPAEVKAEAKPKTRRERKAAAAK